ncbi:uncharacterized protein [Prorops nasuta]|uniref:uncharacterized protein n=1 Tax=Prorops nasuta TaxID=863751 RepID=UPI0034CF6CFA
MSEECNFDNKNMQLCPMETNNSFTIDPNLNDRTKIDGVYKCLICEYQSSRLYNVTRHEKRIHKRKNLIICCDIIFSTKGEYYLHVEKNHPNTRLNNITSREKYQIHRGMKQIATLKDTRESSRMRLRSSMKSQKYRSLPTKFASKCSISLEEIPLIYFLTDERLQLYLERKLSLDSYRPASSTHSAANSIIETYVETQSEIICQRYETLNPQFSPECGIPKNTQLEDVPLIHFLKDNRFQPYLERKLSLDSSSEAIINSEADCTITSEEAFNTSCKEEHKHYYEQELTIVQQVRYSVNNNYSPLPTKKLFLKRFMSSVKKSWGASEYPLFSFSLSHHVVTSPRISPIDIASSIEPRFLKYL